MEQENLETSSTENSSPLPSSWMKYLGEEFQKDYMVNIRKLLMEELEKGKIIYPHGSEMFQAWKETPLDKVKVVIIGQDPYHGPGQAHGLCFSVKKGVRTPPSLVNIYKEINRDLGLPIPDHGLLQEWAKQGVLLLNSVLTVEEARAASHRGWGWERFTDETVKVLNEHCENLVFLLWGSYAQKKAANVDTRKHLVLKSVHPSPLSAHRGFLGCGHFSQANDYLERCGKGPIDWSIH